ncbi:replicative DNA helicase [Opitutus sp. ER46]|uniref:replicative DNA helicase n=1 Tax=Opitutus sp. ER46 TaxID=2161864 RepID=UPI000D319073|nr:replicative DNA helicase [Opitutus sp. ER46]PTX96493.1 replicative DNA helicase [Opitutus sp. ER46]
MVQDTSSSPSRGVAGPPAAPLGRSLPHSLEAEEYLLSCCLLDGADVVSRCLEARIRPESFYDPKHGVIFEKLLDLYNRQQPIDVSVLAEELRTSRQLDEIGGFAFLTQVSSRIPTTAQATYFIEKVRELSLLREIIRSATNAVEDCYAFSGGIDEFVDQVETKIFSVTQNRVSESAKQMREPTREAMNVITKMMMKKGELTGVSSGFKDLDALMWGFQRQEMVILAARPSMGKTSLALNFAEAAAMPPKGTPVGVLVFSLEMSASQLALRMLCSRARVNMKLLRDGLLSKNGEEQNRLLQAADEFSKAPIFIDDSSALSIMQLRAKARRVHARNPLGFIMVDYLQLLSPTDSKMPREQQVAEASRGLKSLAKELDVPVLVLSQLNRSSEKENRTPKLADLRESGSIEQDADVVLMLARPKDADEKFQVAADSAELIVAKQRNGPVGELKLTFLRDITRFENFHP